MKKPETIDEYIFKFPEEVQVVLQKVKDTIRRSAPDAEEKISYAIPTFSLYKKPLIYFAAFEKHIGLYALPTGNEAFAKAFSKYKTGKGSVQFPLDKPMPFGLITKVVKFRIREINKKLSK